MTMSDIVREREQLLARCDRQREYVAALTGQFSGTLKVADTAIAGVKYLRRHPVMFSVIVAVLTAARGRGMLKWAQRGFLAWRAYRSLQN
jgi:hypothetical protein